MSINLLWKEDKVQGPLFREHFCRTVPIKAHVSVTQTLERYKDKILTDLMLEDM